MPDSNPAKVLPTFTDFEAPVQQSEQQRFPAGGGLVAPLPQAQICDGPTRCEARQRQFVFVMVAVIASVLGAVPTVAEEDPNGPASKASSEQLQTLILQLDAEQFNARNEATRQLMAQGPHCIPLLVTSLGAEAREIRFRVSEILRHCFTFDEIAQHLIDAIAAPFGSEARMILRDRALWQVSEIADMENTTRLLDFWGTNVDTVRRRITLELVEARGRDQVAALVTPLIGMQDKAQIFDNHLRQLESLALPFDHRHSPGFVIAETLARGLLENDQQKIQFAHDYIAAFNLLVRELEADGLSSTAIRKEVLDRANMSDGATCFLARLLESNSRERQLMQNRLGVEPESLKGEFVRGIALADSRECYRCVGKVHIADMLLESLERWPAVPQEGVVQSVVDCIVTTISSGDKPKSLALLDALEGCGEIESSGLTVGGGLGEQMAKRLCLAAMVAPNNRACYPVRAIHDRILKILKSGVNEDSDLWPGEFVASYLDGAEEAISDEGRLNIGRYVNVLQLLKDAGLEWEQPGVRQFATLMCASLSKNPQLLKVGSAAVTQLVGDTKQLPADQRRDTIDKALAEWARDNNS